MSKEFQISNGNLIASFDLGNEDEDIDFCKLLKVSHGVANEIGMFVDYVATNKIIKDQSRQISELEAKLADSEESARAVIEAHFRVIEERDKLKQQLADNDEKVNKQWLQIQADTEHIQRLQQQLAERDKEITKLKSDNHSLMSDNAYQEADIFELNSKIEQLKNELKNAVIPKFKIGQEIWETTPLMYWEIKRIEWHKFNGGNGDVVMEIYRLGHKGTDDYNCCIMPVDGDRFFATEEEAKKKLEELNNE